MRKNNYTNAFNELIASVKTLKYLKHISSCEIPFQEKDKDSIDYMVRSITRRTGFNWPEGIEIGVNTSGFQLNWSYEIDGHKQGGGEFDLRDFLLVFSGKSMELGSENDSPEIKNIKDQLSVIDEHPETGDDQFAAFRLESPDKLPPEIWYWNKGVIFKMDITYTGYLDALLALKGINNWHFLFAEDINNEYHKFYYDKKLYVHIADGLEAKINDLEFLFPEAVDYSKYRQLLLDFRKRIES